MSDVDLTALRTPFPAELIGKLPRITCGDCSDKNKQCTKHNKVKCGVCQAYVSERHIHIDYVGHADVTDRLLSVDPAWNWEPKAEDEHGLPVFDTDRNGAPVGLWIKLTVGGVTRLGYGSCPSGQSDAVKVLIGDALRNAAMRFGVALDLWAKGDRADPTAENATASAGQAARRGSGQAGGDAPGTGPQRPRAVPASIDPDAQKLADEAHSAATPAQIEDIHRRARETGKLAQVIRNPASGGGGQLAVYLDWRRKQVAAATRLDPDDPWAAKVEEIPRGDDAAAAAVLEEAAEMLGSGQIDAQHFARIEAAIAARFPEAA